MATGSLIIRSMDFAAVSAAFGKARVRFRMCLKLSAVRIISMAKFPSAISAVAITSSHERPEAHAYRSRRP